MSTLDTCDAGILAPFVRCMEQRGVLADRYLERHRIPPELVVEANGKITRRQAWEFLKDAERREGFASLGFLQGDRFRLTELGPLADAIHRAVTLKDAIDTFCRLLPTVVDGNTAHLVVGGTTSWFMIDSFGFDHSAAPADHFTILPLQEIVRLAAGPAWRPKTMRFITGAAPGLEELECTHGIEHRFSSGYVGIAFDSSLLSKPIKTDRATTMATGMVTPQPTLSKYDQLYSFLKSMNPYGPMLTATETAELFGVSRATLFRHLAMDGVTYNQVMDRVRLESAQKMLDQPEVSIKEIAFGLGYSSPNHFSRTFRRLTGQSPSEYRKKSVP